MAPLSARAIDLYQQFLLSLGSGSLTEALVVEWEALETRTGQELSSMDDMTKMGIAKVANNVLHQVKAVEVVKRVMSDSMDELTRKLDGLLMVNREDRTSKRKLDPSHPSADSRLTSKRQCRPPSTPSHHSIPTITRPPLQVQSSEDLDPVRQFFLQNISYPYPTPSQKDELCAEAGITRRKLESDLTNWRRRSEWTEMMNVYCNGDKGLMKRLVEDIESGKDMGEEIGERYGRMKGYLEKKDEQPGEWVYELANMVHSGQIDSQLHSQAAQSEADNLQLVSVEINSDGLEPFSDSSDHNNTDTDADADADAEGESEPSSPAEGSCIVAQPTMGVRQACSRTQSSLSSISSSPVQYRSSTTTTHTQPDQIEDNDHESYEVVIQPPTIQSNWPPGLFTTTPLASLATRTTSTKSSYSSLSAVSNLAGQSHSRSTSGSTSLRSVSSSSSNAVPAPGSVPIDPRLAGLKRAAPAESFARSSRSRVEDILTEESASWAPGHLPHPGGFHIGAPQPPAHQAYQALPLPYTPYDTQPAAYGDLTPYMMPWSAESGFTYLPHISQLHPASTTPGAGTDMGCGYVGFEMPPEYDFTFTQEPTSAK